MARRGLPAIFDPFEPLMAAWEEDLFDWPMLDLFQMRPRAWAQMAGLAEQTMAMDVTERDDALVVRVTLPGVKPEDVQVEERNGLLVIRAEQKEDQEMQQGRWLVRERRYGHWERAIRLPDNVDAARIRADYANGVLTITVPKREKGKSFLKRIGVSLPRFRLPRPRRESQARTAQGPVKIKVKTK